MGGTYSRNPPPQKYVGGWADGRGTYLVIHPNGSFSYLKKSNNSSLMTNGSPDYDQYGFLYNGYCMPPIEANFYNHHGQRPVFVINGDVLKKQAPGSVEAIVAMEIAVQMISTPMAVPMAAPAMAGGF